MHTIFKRIVSTYDINELSQKYSSNTAHVYGPIHCVVCCMRDRHLSKHPSVSINPFFALHLAIQLKHMYVRIYQFNEMLFSKFIIQSRRLNGHFVCMTFRERQNFFDFSTQFKRYAPLNADPRPYRPQEPFLSTIKKSLGFAQSHFNQDDVIGAFFLSVINTHIV